MKFNDSNVKVSWKRHFDEGIDLIGFDYSGDTDFPYPCEDFCAAVFETSGAVSIIYYANTEWGRMLFSVPNLDDGSVKLFNELVKEEN